MSEDENIPEILAVHQAKIQNDNSLSHEAKSALTDILEVLSNMLHFGNESRKRIEDMEGFLKDPSLYKSK